MKSDYLSLAVRATSVSWEPHLYALLVKSMFWVAWHLHCFIHLVTAYRTLLLNLYFSCPFLIHFALHIFLELYDLELSFDHPGTSPSHLLSDIVLLNLKSQRWSPPRRHFLAAAPSELSSPPLAPAVDDQAHHYDPKVPDHVHLIHCKYYEHGICHQM